MSMTHQTILASRPAAMVLALSLAAGLSVPFVMLPPAHAATQIIPAGTTELSAAPVDQTQAVPVNLAVTFDDSGSMSWTHMGDNPPYTMTASGSTKSGLSKVDWSNGPWRCAGLVDSDMLDGSTSTLDALVMNGVYYNPDVTYTPPVYANGTSFPNAGDSSNGATSLSYLDKVWVDGIVVNRPLSPATAGAASYYNNPDLDTPGSGSVANLAGTASITTTVTYYASFTACPSNADSGSCNSTNPATKGTGTKYYFMYTPSSANTSGSGANEIVSATNLKTGTALTGGTKVTDSTTSSTYNTWTVTTTSVSGSNDNRWVCSMGGSSVTSNSGDDGWSSTSPMDGQSHTLSDGSTVTYTNGGPYYYRLKKGVSINLNSYGQPSTTTDIQTLYTASNWEAVPVPASQYQNFANWYAYYRTRNQMARSALSRVFGSTSLASTNTTTGGFGSTNLRVAWQNLNTSTYQLPSSAIISALMDASGCSASDTKTYPGDSMSPDPKTVQQAGAVTSAPNCYRSAFYNWIFQVPASGGTPTRSAINRSGTFFMRGNGNTGSTGNLEDPYWQPPQTGSFNKTSNPGNELYCRQNFSLLITDGLWNGGADGPKYSTLTLASSAGALPDGVTPSSFTTVTSIYSPVHDNGDTGYASLSDVAYNYWATDLRSDLYSPSAGQIVSPYLPDTYAGLFSGAGNVSFQTGTSDGTPTMTTIPAEEYFNPKDDPATWPHMSSYMVGLGVSGQLNFSTNTDCSTSDTLDADLDACDLRKGVANSTGATGWPTPSGSGNGIAANIDDTWHAALNGRGQFFSAGNPQQLVDQLGSVLSSISARGAAPSPAAVNASVATVGALSFNVGYNADWSGIFQAVMLNSDGTIGSVAWDAGATLDATAASSRNISTDAYNSGTFSSFAFTGANAGLLDAVETAGLENPALAGGNDTLANRIAYIGGDQTHEADGTYRKRNHLLGAIINSQPVYVSYPDSGYDDSWPAGSPEAATGAQTYDAFVAAYTQRAGTVYVGANDGMLHAFNAPVPQCTAYGTSGQCSSYNYGTNPGQEDWAFVPRAVYANLGNLTDATNFSFLPTVDATPVTRDVFFSDNDWHTILTGGVGLGGRGVYALDITGTANSSTPATAPNKVLWEFDSDMTIASGCTSIMGSSADSIGCRATDLGYTVSQPNIGRLANGKWVVLVSNGYFPDCTQADIPTATKASCQTIAAQTPTDSSKHPYSSLFVLDAETGNVIAELKTPTNLTLSDGSGLVTSFGLASPVLGDYNGDQIDDVAFAGDLQGNLWRFDLSSSSPSGWTVTLVYQGNDDGSGNQGLQPITTMPRLFPDPATNRFMVVFGTGKYLGAQDNGTTTTQALIGVRDVAGTTFTQANLTQDYLHETTASATLPDGLPNPNAGATLRCVTGKSTDTCDTSSTTNPPSPVNPIPAVGQTGGGGWFVNLQTYASDGTTVTDQGERVVVSPGAIFASNTVVFETLLTGSSGNNPCNPTTQGAFMALNAVTGAPAGVSSLGGGSIVGARINNARTSGSLPVVSALGGGQVYLPGLTIAPGNNPVSIDAPIWRRRSWNEVNQDQ